MQVIRQKLVQHMERIACNDQIKEAVFSSGFETTALTADKLLLVIAPELEGVEPLPERVGMFDIPKFVKSLGAIAGPGNEGTNVSISLEAGRFVINEDHRGVIRLLTASPDTIGTKVEQATVKKLLEKEPTGAGIPLTRSLLDGIKTTFSLFKATEVELFVGPNGGKIKVGNDTSDVAEFSSADFKDAQEYSLRFRRHFVDVMSVIVNYSEAVLRLGGPSSYAVVQDGGFKYLLSSVSKDANA